MKWDAEGGAWGSWRVGGWETYLEPELAVPLHAADAEHGEGAAEGEKDRNDGHVLQKTEQELVGTARGRGRGHVVHVVGDVLEALEHLIEVLALHGEGGVEDNEGSGDAEE